MTQNLRIGRWFLATATTFLTRALLFSTWQSRSPEVMESLKLSTTQMGLLVMLYPVGGLLGIAFASHLNQKFGARKVTFASFTVGSVAMVLLGSAITQGNVWLSSISLLLMGLPMALADFTSNYEGTEVDKRASKSLLPAIHASFGVGMILAAALSSAMIQYRVDLLTNYISVAILVWALSIWASTAFPKNSGTASVSNKSQKAITRQVWAESRTFVIAFIGLSFILAELSAGTWVPIALKTSGLSSSEAAAAFGMFWLIITSCRAIGGFVVDRIGRFATVLGSALITAAGISVFIFDTVIHQPYLGLVLWGGGLALGFPMAANALSDDPVRSPARINLMITLVYVSSVSVGPLLGSIGNQFGLFVAFTVPLLLMVSSAALSRFTKPTEI